MKKVDIKMHILISFVLSNPVVTWLLDENVISNSKTLFDFRFRQQKLKIIIHLAIQKLT